MLIGIVVLIIKLIDYMKQIRPEWQDGVKEISITQKGF
jgi:hypothetical protein